VFDDLVEALAGRPGWSVAGKVAEFTVTDSAWTALVRVAHAPDKRHHTFHIALTDGSGVARFTRWAGTVPEAIRLAEGHTRGQATTGPSAPPARPSMPTLRAVGN